MTIRLKTPMNKVLMSTLMGSFLTTASANALAGESEPASEYNGVYLNAHLGTANSNADVGSVQAAANDAAIALSVESVDDVKNGFGIGLGYEFSPSWAAELNYLDMGQVDVRFNAIQAVNNLADIHAESGDGLTLSGLYKYALDERAQLRARLGVFNWDAQYDTVSAAGGVLGQVEADGTDLYWGLGFAYQLSQSLSFTAEYQQFEFDNDARQYWRAGLEWHFMD